MIVDLANNIFNQDFQDFLTAFNQNEVHYVLIGGYAVILHGYQRTTGDLDIWVRRTPDNYDRIVQAFQDFGMLVFDMTKAKFLSYPKVDVFSFGVSPVRIDLMTHAKGLDFDVAYNNSSSGYDPKSSNTQCQNHESLGAIHHPFSTASLCPKQ